MIWQCAYSWYDSAYCSLSCVHRYTGIFLLHIYRSAIWLGFVMGQVRFALSTSSIFSKTDTVTDSERFYNTMLDLFNLADKKKDINDLLTWWNWYVIIPNTLSMVTESLYLYYRQIFSSYLVAWPSIDQDSPLARIKAKRSALQAVVLNE